MKKLCFLLLTGLLLTACSSEDSPITEEPLTPMNTPTGFCSYDIGDTSCVSATYSFETREGYGGNREKIMTFHATLDMSNDQHHSGAFRVYFFKDAEMTQQVLGDNFIHNDPLTMELNITNYRETKLYVLFRAGGACSENQSLTHGFRGEISLDPYAESGSGRFTFSIVNGDSKGLCSYPIGNVSAHYTLEQRQNPQTGNMDKIATFTANLSGYCDPHHSPDRYFRVYFFEDAALTKPLSGDGYMNNETFTIELNVTDYKGSSIFVTITPPGVCSTQDYRTKHYFLGEAPFDRYEDTGTHTFEFATMSK